ncbi:LysR family transcriptional regulator (plasmid) [Mycolicibacterium arabiense]|uniref:Probable hydrogen peroxide-inducible genes activator n=1 Tax=Mycolicibacterium arabiense TaxID=1286181 RepID=A0A7I7RR95_9MYCO|nr:LysR family transcriptional regulator [Mycolicibacterium arabiense]MCV7376929.1 LysR family transcriptional regulator [Mycolicibacterium arabiense]BBY46740.1 LysR family transcriptional regulator [Mycolicibacterium arabiense]
MATLRALQCLVALVEHGSISAAAAALELSLPALSHQIASLEKELGAPVVERQRRGVRVTAVGRATAEEARIALRAAEQAVTVGRRVGGEAGDRLRISCDETMTAWLLAPILRRWRAARPDVQLDLMEFTDSAAALASIDEDRADVAIGAHHARTTGLVTMLGEEDVVVLARLGHRFADGPDVAMTELSTEPFVHYHPADPFAEWIDRHAALHDVVLKPMVRTRSPNTAAQLAIAGLGVTIVPVSVLHSLRVGVARPLSPRLDREVVAVVSRTPHVLALEFLEDARQRRVPGWRVPA